MQKLSFFLIFLLTLFPQISNSNVWDKHPLSDSFEAKRNAWVNKIMVDMTLEEKVGQLFMISAYSNKNESEYRLVESQIKKYHLGGIAFFQGNAVKQAELTNRYQTASKVPMLIATDGEWGLGMRLQRTVSFPKAITLGATKDPDLIERVSEEIARQYKRIGVHFNFAPDADINSNPKNPVINYRSFGESVENVSTLTRAFVRGHKKYNIMTSPKHFPGHGDTHTDSHNALPELNHSMSHIYEIETAPFVELMKDSVPAIMVGHLNVTAIDKGVPASISEKVINGFLKKDLGYEGIVISDALNMRGLLRNVPVGEAEVRAFKAGNDILLQTANINRAYEAVLNACKQGRITEDELDYSVRKILMAKYWVGLNEYKPVDLRNIQNDINTELSNDLIQQVYDKAVTITQDDYGIVPLKGITNLSMVSLGLGANPGNQLQSTLELYGDVTSYMIQDRPNELTDWHMLAEEASQKDLVIASVHKLQHSERSNYGVTNETLKILKYIQERTKLIVCVFGNPYSLKFFDEFETVIHGYEDVPEAHQAVANILFGVNPVQGKIPVNTLSEDAKLDYGYELQSFNRLGYGLPREVGMDRDKLQEINKIVNAAINNKEFPGAQVLVAKKGKVVYYEAFGYLNYDLREPVTKNTIYDLASITKVASTLQAIMMLYDQGKLDIDRPLSHYLPELNATDKGKLIIKDILLHQAGLRAFYPFYNKTIQAGVKYNSEYFSEKLTRSDQIKISDKLFVNPSLKDSVFKWVAESSLTHQPKQKYTYSDLGLLLMQQLVERITHRNLEDYIGANLYKPMGLINMMFAPLNKKSIAQIAPTENGGDFRSASIRGTVHDPNAALLGGNAGHAGLFSNAWDLARLMQMNLNGGNYDDLNYFSKNTIDFFTKKSSSISHRAIGWNRPSGPRDGTVSEFASASTYGHTGFTGTAVWVDPENEMIFVFLSNRVNPSATNQKLITNKTRKKIHDVAYKAIIDR